MSNEFIGYTIAPGWKKLTLFRFDAKTHARICVEEIRPFMAFTKEQRRQVVIERLEGLKIPIPPASIEPK